MRLCQRVVVLDHGATLASGTPDEVTHHPDVVRAYLGEVV
jgi:branched-chain amino acid transport system ATP-binding protein